MKTFEEFLQEAISKANEYGRVNLMGIGNEDRVIITKLQDEGLIENVSFISMIGVGFDLTYDGLHYFDVE